MGFVIPRFCYIGSTSIKGFNILGSRDIGFITPAVRYTGVRPTGILLGIGVPYAGISLCKVHCTRFRYTEARYTRISLYIIGVRYTRISLRKVYCTGISLHRGSLYQISLYIVVRYTGISPYRASFHRNLVL